MAKASRDSQEKLAAMEGRMRTEVSTTNGLMLALFGLLVLIFLQWIRRKRA
jgi:hypothetical protein